MNIQKLELLSSKLLSILYSLLFIVTPFLVYHKTSELFEFNKILFIYLITGVIGSIWVLRMIIYKKIILKKTPLDVWILLFVMFQIVSTIFSIDRHTSLFGYYGRFNGGLLSTFSYALLYYCFTSHTGSVFDRKWVSRLLKISLVVSLGVVVWGLSGWFGYDLSCLVFTGNLGNSCWTESFKPNIRMFSTLGQPNWLGAYLAVNIPIGLYYLEKTYEKSKKLLNIRFISSAISLFLLISGVLATKSRSAMLAVFISVVIYFGLKFLLSQKNKAIDFGAFVKPMLTVLVLGIISLFIFKSGIPAIDKLVSPSQTSTSISRENSTTPERKPFISKSTDIRRIVWEGAVNLGLAYPLFGTGVETFGYSYYFKRPLTHNLTSEWDYLYNRAHNEYLNYFATSGFTGLVSYLLLLTFMTILMLGHVRKEKDLLSITLFCGWITLLITNFFGFSTSVSSLYLFLIPGFVIALTAKNQEDVNAVEQNKNDAWKVAYIVPVITLFATLNFVGSYFMADTNYNLGQMYLENQDFKSSISFLQKALRYKYEHLYEDKLAYAFAQGALVGSSDKTTKGKEVTNKLFQAARYYSDKTITASPKNMLYYKTASKIEFLSFQVTQDMEDFESAIDNLEFAQSLAPTEPKIPYTKGLFYSSYYDQTKDNQIKSRLYKLALHDVNTAIKLKENYRDAYFLKGTLLKKGGDVEGGKEEFQYILKNIDPLDQEVKAELEKR